MSETDVVDSVPVTKDPTLINGENGLHSPDIQNGDLNDPIMDKPNGVDHGEHSGVNGDVMEPVNGDVNGQVVDDDLMGEDDLPPPPEVVSELPPPPSSDFQEEDLPEDDNVVESGVIESEPEVLISEPPVNVVEDLIDVNEDVNVAPVNDNEGVSEAPADVNETPVVDNIEVKPAMDISDEELVSDSGLQDEVVDTEGQDNQVNEAVEQAEAPLVDLGEPEPELVDCTELVGQPQPEQIEQVEPVPDEVPEIADVPPPPPSGPLVPVSYEMVDVEVENVPEVQIQPEPVVDMGSSVDPELSAEQPQEPEIPEPPVEQMMEPVADEPVVNQESVVTEEAPVELEQEPEVPEPGQEVYQPQPEPVEVIPVETEPLPEVQQIPEVNVTQEEQDVPAVEQAQVGYAEPDIIVDNKPVADEPPREAVPPPPPPPLEEPTPPPPPPLDENVPLKRDRKSGGSTPNKQSPSKEIVSPSVQTVESVTEPVLEAVKEPEPPRQEVEPVMISQIQEPAVERVPDISSTPVVAPVADLSPPGSPSVKSEPALSDGGQGEPVEPHTAVTPQVSQKINKKNFKNKIKFGVDLVEAALKQLSFLTSVNNEPGLYEEWLFKKAIRRYEAFWLPLAAEHKKENLAAPLDIEWLWHCHMLAPLSYEADSKNLVGIVVEHKLMSDKDRTKSLEKSKKYWLAKYPNEPFEIDLVYKEKEPELETPVQEAQPVEANAALETQAESQPTEQTEKEPELETPVQEAQPVEANAASETQAESQPTEQTGDQEVTPTGLAPTASEEDTKTEEHSDESKADDVTEQTEQLQEETKTEAPAEVQPSAPEDPSVPTVPEEGYEQKCSYDIYSAMLRQRVFYYQVSLPHFHDKSFLKAAVKRYQRFLFLKHQNPTEMLAPCYDIDLIWHAHQLHPSAYKHDTTKVLGQILIHNDSINDRSTGSKLQRADQKTRDLWKTLFDDTFVTYGSTFRGEPPVLCEKMAMIAPEETYAFSTKKATVNLDKVQVEGLPEEVNKYSVKLAYGTTEGDGPLIKQLKGNKKKIEFENIKKGLAHFVFDTKEYDRIRFNMSQQIGFACAGHDEEIGQQWFNLMPVVENIPKSQSEAAPLTDSVTIDEENNLKATFSATIEPPKQGPTMLFLKNGTYETRFCIMPEQVVQMWGPIPLPRLPAGRDNHCVVASHKFLNHTGEITFTCRVIHSLPLLMSAVQVFYHSRMAAVAHLVGSDQIPTPSQVFYHSRMAAVAHLVGSDQIPTPSQLSDPKKIFSLNPAEGQRGILIKNQTGDWGLIRGQWTGFRKAQPAVAATKGKKAKKEVAWSPGTLSVSFYKLGTGAWQHLSLPYQQDSYKFTIQDANVDLKSGTIQINSDSNEVAENLALGFSVALLHVLCQPRYVPPPPPEPVTVTEQATPTPVSPANQEQPPAANQDEAPPTTETEEKPAEGEPDKTADEALVAPVSDAQPESPPPSETPATPKSPTIKSSKSEPGTPSKKVKELPPIPTFELGLVLAAGYNIETATNDHIKKTYGDNACAGCVAVGMDVGVGQIGQVATQVQAEVEVAEAGEACDVGEVEDVGQDNIEMGDGMEMGADGMDAMGDAGGAACGGF